MYILTAVLLSIITPYNTASGATYKWVDEDGNIHFSDRPSVDQESAKYAPEPLSSYATQTGSENAESISDNDHDKYTAEFIATQEKAKQEREARLKKQQEEMLRPEECQKLISKFHKVRKKERHAKLKGKYTKWLKLNEELEQLQLEAMRKCPEYL